MARRNYFDHKSPEGVRAGERIKRAGYQYAGYGENIAVGQLTVSEVVADWIKSPGHCRNLMDPKLSEFAVACVTSKRDQDNPYWTMNIGRPR